MTFEENEDPQDRADRLDRANKIRRLHPQAVDIGLLSLGTTLAGAALGVIVLLDAGPQGGTLVPGLAVILLLIGQIATLVTYWKIMRLKLMGSGESCLKPALLGIPGMIVSTALALRILLAIL